MLYKENLKEALDSITQLCDEFPELRTEGIELNKIVDKDVNLIDFYYAVDILLDKISTKSERTFDNTPCKIKIIKLKDHNVFKIIIPLKNDKELTVCNVSEDKYNDRYGNTVLSFDEIIEELVQVKIDELKGKGPFEPDYSFVDQAYLEELEGFSEEKRKKYESILMKGSRDRNNLFRYRFTKKSIKR